MKIRAHLQRWGVVLLMATLLGGLRLSGDDDRPPSHDDRGEGGGVGVSVDVTSLFNAIFNGAKKKKRDEEGATPATGSVKKRVANDTDCPERFEKLWTEWLAFKQYVDALNMAIADRDAAYADLAAAYEALHEANIEALNAQMVAQRQPGNAAAAQAAATAQAAADKALAAYNDAVTKANQAQDDVVTMHQAYNQALADYLAKVNDYDKHCIDYRAGPRPLPPEGDSGPPDLPGSSDATGNSAQSSPDSSAGGKKPGASKPEHPGGGYPPKEPHPGASTPDNPNGQTPGNKPPPASTPDHPGTPDKPKPGSTPDTPPPSTPEKPPQASTPDKPAQPTAPDKPNPSTPDNPNPAGTEPGKPPELSKPDPDNPYPGTRDGGDTGWHWPWNPTPVLVHNDDDCDELYAKLVADMLAYKKLCNQISEIYEDGDECYEDAETLVHELNQLAQDYQALAKAGQGQGAAASQIFLKMSVDQAALTDAESYLAKCNKELDALQPQCEAMFNALVKEIAAYNKHCPAYKVVPPWPKDFGPFTLPEAPAVPAPSKDSPTKEPEVPVVGDSFGTPSTQDRDDYCAALLAKAKAAQKAAYLAGQKFYAALDALNAARALVKQLEQASTDAASALDHAEARYCGAFASNHHGGTSTADDVNHAWDDVKKAQDDLKKANDAQAQSQAYAKAVADEKVKSAASDAAYAACKAASDAFGPLYDLYKEHCGPYPYDQFNAEFEKEFGPEKASDANEPPPVGDFGGPIQPHM